MRSDLPSTPGSSPAPHSTGSSSESTHSGLVHNSSSSSTDPQPGFTPFEQMVSGGSRSGTLGSASSGLENLQNLLEALDTLPFVKYLATVGIQVLKHVIAAQDANDMFTKLAFRAKDIILAVARSCHGKQTMAEQLEADLRQLTNTMENILAFAKERVSRRTFKKLLSKADDSASVKALDIQLTHAVTIFGVGTKHYSPIGAAITHRAVTIKHKHPNVTAAAAYNPSITHSLQHRPGFVAKCHLRVQEGIYIIKNVADGRVIETVDHKPVHCEHGNVHAYMAPFRNGKLQTQLWSIQKKDNEEFEFTIRSMATGLALDVFRGMKQQGTKVGTHSYNGLGLQTWSIWGTRQGIDEDYCTIRSIGVGTILDGLCPKDRLECDALHATAMPSHGFSASQEWNLIRISSPPAVVNHDSQESRPDVAFPRRPVLLQNVLTGMLATRTDNVEGPNVMLSPSPTTPNSSWTFVYAEIHQGNIRTDCFAIASSSDYPCTMDHWGSVHISVISFGPLAILPSTQLLLFQVSKSWLSNHNHMWAPISRDGVFIFRNVASGALLAASGSQQGYVDTLPASARDDPACHWRLLDPTKNERIPILYDSGLSILPTELSGITPVAPPLPMALELRTGTAPPETRLAMLKSLAQEHDTIRAMLLEGYKALVVAPRMISGWKDGQVKRVEVGKDEDAMFKYRAHVSLHPCEPR
ncbi:hypothetical protein PENSPDRAFT_695130 [Peniophora sp. CONT]|nr:hypothetical protein PENSPDRAFT_695130 [Peniophora sp. CONT]